MAEVGKLTKFELNAALGQTSNMARNMAARRQVMEADPRCLNDLRLMGRCMNPHPCNKKHCPTCAVPATYKKRLRLYWADFRARQQDLTGWSEHPEFEDLMRPSRSRNFRIRSGQWMYEPFVAINPENVFAGTIDLCVVSTCANLQEVVARERLRLRRGLKTRLPQANLRGKFSYVLKYADELSTAFKDHEVPSFMQGNKTPHIRVAMFHIHFLIHAPGMSREEIRDHLKACGFKEPKRVCLKTEREIKIDENGIESGGFEGWGEYSGMDKVVLDFDDENTEAFKEVLGLDSTWKRASQNFSYGVDRKTCGLQTNQIEAPPNYEEILRDAMNNIGTDHRHEEYFDPSDDEDGNHVSDAEINQIVSEYLESQDDPYVDPPWYELHETTACNEINHTLIDDNVSALCEDTEKRYVTSRSYPNANTTTAYRIYYVVISFIEALMPYWVTIKAWMSQYTSNLSTPVNVIRHSFIKAVLLWGTDRPRNYSCNSTPRRCMDSILIPKGSNSRESYVDSKGYRHTRHTHGAQAPP